VSIDRERAQVYAAELAAFDGTDLESVVGIEAVGEAIDGLVRGDWWPGPPVAVRPTRRDAHSSSARCAEGDGDDTSISIAPPQATLATGAHELAHALAGVNEGHGARFRRAHLDVIAAMTNRDRVTGRGDLHVDQLRAAYDAAGLAVAGRDWPEPPSAGTAIAL